MGEKIKKTGKNGKYYIFLSFIILFLAVLIFHQYVFQGYFFFSQGVLSDLLRANLPTYYHLYDTLAQGGGFWSWSMGIGTSMFTHADVYFDPFTYILFIFGRDYIPNMMIWLFIVKLVFEGGSLFTYLDYFKLDKRASLIASVLYAFSGYSLIMGSNFALGTILVYAPLVFLGIEKWLDTGRLRMLFISLFLVCIYSYYFFYVTGILVVIYLCVRLYQRKNNFIPKLVILGIVAAAVILASSFALLPQIQLAMSSSRVSGAKDVPTGIALLIPQIKVWITALVRTINNDILGSRISTQYLGYSYFGTRDYFQISCFSGALTYILLAQYWNNEKKNRKNMILVFVVLSVMTLFPFFSYVLNAFSTVSARWMFVIAIVQCLAIAMSVDSIIKKGKLDGKSLIYGIVFSIVVLVAGMCLLAVNSGDMASQIGTLFFTARKFLVVLGVLYAVVVMIYFLQKKTSHWPSDGVKKTAIYLLLGLIVLLDEGVNYYHWYGIDASVCVYDEEHRSSYDDTSAELVKKIEKKDDSFYRIQKDFDSVYDEYDIPSENDAMVQEYYGLKCYNSVNNANYIAFLQGMGIYAACPINVSYYEENGIEPAEVTGNALNYIDGTYDRYKVMSYLGVKYFMTKDKDPKLPAYLSYYTSQGDVQVYQNNHYMPLAFVNSEIMKESDFAVLSEEEKDEALFRYTIVPDDMDIAYNGKTSQADVEKISREKQEAFQLKEFSSDDVKFTIDVPDGGQILSLTVPYDKDWHVIVDGKEAETCKVNISLLGAFTEGGSHTVELVYRPAVLKPVLIASVGMLLLVLVFGRKFNKYLNQLEMALNNLRERIIRLARLEKVKNALVKLLTACIYAGIALSISAGSLYVLAPSIFEEKYDIQSVSNFEGVENWGLKMQDNEFEAEEDNAGFGLKLDQGYSYIQIKFKSVTNNSGAKNTPVRMYYATGDDTFLDGRAQAKYVSNDKMNVTFEHVSEQDDRLWFIVGTEAGDTYAIDSIQFYNTRFSMTGKGFLLWLGGGAVVLAILLYVTKRVKKNTNVTRDSNIELCRIICMLMIVAHHCVLHGGAFDMEGMSTNRILSLFLIPGGKLCFDCFLAISCWFLVDQKFRTKRFLKVWFMNLFYSVVFTGVACLFGKAVSFKNWLSVFLPITGNSHGFAATYLAFYLLLPFLTMVSQKLKKKQARWLWILLLYLEVGSQLIGCFNQYYQPFASEILLFVLCYFTALNLKKWPLKITENKKWMLFIFCAIWVALFMVRFQYVQNGDNAVLAYIMNTMCDESSISNLVGGFALFFFFKDLKVKKMPMINFLATGTFGVLLIHDHNFFRSVLWKDILKTDLWYGSSKFVIYVGVYVILVFAVCFAIDKMRFYLLEERIFKSAKVKEFCEKCDRALIGVKDEE